MKLLHVGGRRIALARTERGYVAFDDRCTHRGGSLAAGVHDSNRPPLEQLVARPVLLNSSRRRPHMRGCLRETHAVP